MLVGEAAPSGPVGGKVLAKRAGQFLASAERLASGLALALVVLSATYRFVFDTSDIRLPQEKPPGAAQEPIKQAVRLLLGGPAVAGILEEQAHKKDGHASHLTGRVNEFGD